MRKIRPEEQIPKTRFNFWLLFISIIWVAGAMFLLLQTEPCPGKLQFAEKYLSCRSANELGDYLAGVFAPLAFIWLAGAVVIQSYELSAQRIELQLTRKNQEAQFSEMKAQAEYIGEQTKLLKFETEDRRRTFTSREITHCLGTLQRLASSTGSELTISTDGEEKKITFALNQWGPLRSLLVTVGGLKELEGYLAINNFKLISGKLPLKGIQRLLKEAISISLTQETRERIAFEEFDLDSVLSNLGRMIDAHPEICL